VIRFLEIACFSGASILAFVGWGRTLELVVRCWEGGSPSLPLPTGVAAGLGLAVSLVAAGPLVAIDLFLPGLGLAWLALGLVAALRLWRPVGGLRSSLQVRRGLQAVVLGIQAIYLTLHATLLASWSPFDDTVAYLPLIRRLSQTGGLIEPFSQRRMGTLGGFTALQAVFGAGLGANTSFVADVVVGGLLVGLLLLSNRVDPSRLVLGALLVGSFTLWDTRRVNLSPTYLVVALLGAAVVLTVSRSRRQGLDRGLLLYLGVLGAGLLTLRTSDCAPLVLFALVVIARAPGAALKHRGAAAALLVVGVVLVCLPWMIALWRSSSTPLFPLFGGNFNPAWPGFSNPATANLSGYGSVILGVIGVGSLKWMLVGLAVVAATAWALARPGEMASASTAMAAAAITAAVYLVASLTSLDVGALSRLVWPILAGALVGALAVLADLVSLKSHWRLRAAFAVVVAAMAITFAGSLHQVRTNLHFTLAAVKTLIVSGLTMPTYWQPVAADYRRVQLSLPRRARVALATDYSQLFDYARNDFMNLDIIGSVSPAPGLPFFQGAQAKVAYLRQQGIDYLVVTQSSHSVSIWNATTWSFWISQLKPTGRLWAPYFLDWFSTLNALRQRNPNAIHDVGSLTVFDLRRL
jgi:hypothetical protein